MRILIAGSSQVRNAWLIHASLVDTLRARGMWDEDTAHPTGDVTVVTRSAPGPDRLAADWADLHGCRYEVHDVRNGRHGKGAGRRVMEGLVAAGGDILLCFLAPCRSEECSRTDPHDGHGAAQFAAMAEAAGIPVQRIREAR